MSEATNENRSGLRWFALTAAAVIAVAAASFLLLGKTVSEKLLTELCLPLGLLWITLTALCVVLTIRKQFWPLLIAGLAWCCCFVAGNSYVASRMIRSLENEYYGVDPFAIPPLEAVVLLGGATREAPNGQVQINDNGDRIVLAARMYHRDLAKRIICTGARIEGLSTLKLDEAQASRLLLTDLGVAAAAIETYGGRNTSEEMQHIAKELGSDMKVGVITSAWHLPRAMRLAIGAGINAVPLPANFNSGERDESKPTPWGKRIRRCIPNQTALSTNSRVLKEYLARLVGR